MTLRLFVGLLASYALGAIPASYLLARRAGIDLRRHGSRNLGATNLYRVLGWRYAVPGGLADMAKGVVPVLGFAPLAGPQPWVPLALGAAAVVGHVFSVFVRFRGGKGVATAAGALLALEPAAFGLTAAVWAGVLAVSRYVSLASLTAAVCFPILVWRIHPERPDHIALAAVLAAFIVFTHRSNIRRLLTGTEHRVGGAGRAV